jgi:uncharacterized protein YqjF (DUF2071 family)
MTYPISPRIRFPVMFQSWRYLTFLHWRYPVEAVAAHVPKPLEVETIDGSAWVAVTPFIIDNLRPPFVPALPWLSRFPETNCRTYVRAPDGTAGVWFFSLDAARAAAVLGARLGYGLPYAWSRMRVTIDGPRMVYWSRRRWPDRVGAVDAEVEHGDLIEQNELEICLTARFRLYAMLRGRLVRADVDHPPWPLRQASVGQLRQTLTSAAGLPDPVGPPLVHYSENVKVRVGAPRPL